MASEAEARLEALFAVPATATLDERLAIIGAQVPPGATLQQKQALLRTTQDQLIIEASTAADGGIRLPGGQAFTPAGGGIPTQRAVTDIQKQQLADPSLTLDQRLNILGFIVPPTATEGEKRLALSQAQGAAPEATFVTGEGQAAPRSVEELIQFLGPEATGILGEGTQQAIDLTGQATQQAIGQLQPFAGTEAFREQASLLGILGPEEQAQALAGLQPTGVEQEQSTRQRRSLLRQAAARGEFGAGSTIQGLQGLAGAQEAQLLERRLGELEGLSGISRGALSAISGLEETGGSREAALLAGLGPQQANILLGSSAPIVQAQQQQAQLSALQGLASAQQKGQIAGQVANLAGQTNLFGLGGLFQQPPPTSQLLAGPAPTGGFDPLAGFQLQP